MALESDPVIYPNAEDRTPWEEILADHAEQLAALFRQIAECVTVEEFEARVQALLSEWERELERYIREADPC